jgi:hypothetical protein
MKPHLAIGAASGNDLELPGSITPRVPHADAQLSAAPTGDSTVREQLTAKRSRACPACGARPKRPKRQIETDEYATSVERQILRWADRIATGEIDELGRLVDLDHLVEEARQRAVDGLREFGYSWAEIGRRAGMTKQSAHERWGKKEPEHDR